MYQAGVPESVYREGYDLIVSLVRFLQHAVLQLGGRGVLVAYVLHDQAVLLESEGLRDGDARIPVPVEVAVLLPGPGIDQLPAIALYVAESGVPFNVFVDPFESGSGGPEYLQGHRLAVRVLGVEYVALLPRGYRESYVLYHTGGHEVVDGHQGLGIEDLCQCASLVSALVCLQRIYSALQISVDLLIGCHGTTLENIQVLGDPVPLAQVHGLSPRVSESYVAFVRLEIPNRDYHQVALSDPHPFLDLSRDAADPGDPVLAHYAYLRGPEQLVSYSEHLSFFYVRQTYT
ncbi:hypothetical protein SDC9_116122 [bioreactor metagenome]|uniref:Uncharacterized protein n=1 Tax=bioreactor metagenome TaxID=1076179 RepID=A0A645BVQ6_9ZZZZ